MILSIFSIICLVVACEAIQNGRSAVKHRHNLLHQKSEIPLYGNATADSPFWLSNILHQGLAPFHAFGTNSTKGYSTGANSTGINSTSQYQVFRNVKEFGAKGR